MEKRRQPEVIAGRVNGDGTIASGDGFTVARTGTGTYTVTLAGGFRLISATVSRSDGGQGFMIPSAWTERSFNVSASSTGLVAGDAPFAFIASGVQT